MSAEGKEMKRHLWKRIQEVLVTAVLLTLAASVPASAGVWKTGEDDPDSWWYDHQDGTWAVGWELIDGNRDGLGEWYLFDEDGWLITDFVTKEGYEVDENGAWVQNGAVVHVRMDGSGTASGGGAASGSGAASGGGTGSSGNTGAAQAAADVPPGKYRMDRLIYNDGSSREAPSDRTWYLECAPWGSGMITAFSSVDKKGGQTLRYQEYQKEGSGRWIFRDEEDGAVTRLLWNRESGTIEVTDADLSRHYIRIE